MSFTKDPDAILDYSFDWGPWLAMEGDTIFTSIWIVPSGINEDSNTHDATTTTVWLSGGTVGTSYSLVNRIETTGGRTDDRTMKIRIKQK